MGAGWSRVKSPWMSAEVRQSQLTGGQGVSLKEPIVRLNSGFWGLPRRDNGVTISSLARFCGAPE